MWGAGVGRSRQAGMLRGPGTGKGLHRRDASEWDKQGQSGLSYQPGNPWKKQRGLGRACHRRRPAQLPGPNRQAAVPFLQPGGLLNNGDRSMKLGPRDVGAGYRQHSGSRPRVPGPETQGLSASKATSEATCHQPSKSWEEGLCHVPLSPAPSGGHQVPDRVTDMYTDSH